MTIDHRAEVERLLDGPPSALAFRALCVAVGQAGGSADLVARCAERLAHWPDETREAPWSWLAGLEAGVERPTWPLVRSLTLRSAAIGIVDLALPDPRVMPDLTHLDLGRFAHDQLDALSRTADQWPGLRSVRTGHLTQFDAEAVARLATSAAVARLDSLVLVGVEESLWHFEIPPFRPAAGPPWRLRHAGLRAPDLVHLLRSGLVPDLRSAEVLVSSLDEARDLAECPELAGLDRLAIGFRVGRDGMHVMGRPVVGNVLVEDDEACEVFFARADLAGLRDLAVVGATTGPNREGLGPRGVDAVVASGVLPRLTGLRLERLPLGDAALTRVLAAVDPDRLEELALVDVVATDATAAAFAGTFPWLRSLDLSRNVLGPEGARRLATDVRLPELRRLDLSGGRAGSPYYGRNAVQPIGDAGVAAWARSSNADRLTHLALAAVGLGMPGLTSLLELTGFESLDLAHNPLGDWSPAFRDAPVWNAVERLDVTACGLGDDAVEALTATASAPRLHRVSLAYNSLGSRSARALAEWPLLPQLWELDLHDHVIGDDGLRALATSGAAARLLTLDLEQDCWNTEARSFDLPLPDEVVALESFPGLDTLLLGVVDEYHGARYSCGFPSYTALLASGTARPELRAFLAVLDPEELTDTGSVGGDPDRDFRTRWAERHVDAVAEAVDFARRLAD
ncbi:hypothetical protein [Umezawaea sp. NPDC059074]|uniref:hypothetical protein n=1 Tax=Umezawaea sp. NPDC059074 TaxID=3346716 RepID=UPI0036809EE1